jgi:hypothetical protein
MLAHIGTIMIFKKVTNGNSHSVYRLILSFRKQTKNTSFSLKLRDSVICNTGDSITVLTVQTHGTQCAPDSNAPQSVPPSPAPSSTASHSSEGESDISDVLPEMKKTKFVCRFDMCCSLKVLRSYIKFWAFCRLNDNCFYITVLQYFNSIILILDSPLHSTKCFMFFCPKINQWAVNQEGGVQPWPWHKYS